MEKFGLFEAVALWRVRTDVTWDLESINRVGHDIANKIDMEITQSMYGKFPARNGKGGNGIQYYWEWTESFLVISTWPELNFLRVYLASCKPFQPDVVTDYLVRTIGPIMCFEFTHI